MVLAEVSLDDALDDALSALAVAVEETQATIERGPLPRVLGERRMLAQVLQNLISNSIRFRGDQPPHVLISAARVADRWLVTVADQGLGIPAGQEEQAFGPFEVLGRSERVAGTGMGLSLCRRIIQRHGGSIWVDTEAKAGCVVRFTLPA